LRLIQFLGLGACIALSACSQGYGGLDPQSTAVRVQTELPPPDPQQFSADVQQLRLGPQDSITVRVFGVEDLDTTGTIDSAGIFTMPLIGPVQAGGLTTSELSNRIADQLRGRFVREPYVTIEIEEVRSQTVTVDGAVVQPGVYPVLGRMSLMRAIATARGANEFAALNSVAVFRTIDGQPSAALFSLKDIREGRYPDPQIYANDTIVVGESSTRRLIRDLSQIIPAFGVFTPLANRN
jgi:polysaccharide biosynthesis/export protein